MKGLDRRGGAIQFWLWASSLDGADSEPSGRGWDWAGPSTGSSARSLLFMLVFMFLGLGAGIYNVIRMSKQQQEAELRKITGQADRRPDKPGTRTWPKVIISPLEQFSIETIVLSSCCSGSTLPSRTRRCSW